MYCHSNFGPLVILVLGTKITDKIGPDRQILPGKNGPGMKFLVQV